MEKNTPVRKPHMSTADLLTWPENQPFESPAAVASRSAARSHQVTYTNSVNFAIYEFEFRETISAVRSNVYTNLIRCDY